MPNISRICRRLLNRLGLAGLPKPPAPILSLLGLLASLAVGLIPPALLLLFSLGWLCLPAAPGLDITWFTLAALLLAPFAAGYANCRWRRVYALSAGALPAFLLWAAAFALYYQLFGLPEELRRAGISLLIALLMGIAGGMSAAKIQAKGSSSPNSNKA